MSADSRGVLNRPADGPDAVVRYGDHPDQLVDLHLPPTETATAPVLVLLHGGFWRHEWDRRHTRPMAAALRGDGWIVVTPEFRRTGGDGGWPATFDDIATVRERLPDLVHIAIGRRDIEPLTLLGHSAGGQLAMWWALTAPDPATVRRAVGLAPVADLARAHAEGWTAMRSTPYSAAAPTRCPTAMRRPTRLGSWPVPSIRRSSCCTGPTTTECRPRTIAIWRASRTPSSPPPGTSS